MCVLCACKTESNVQGAPSVSPNKGMEEEVTTLIEKVGQLSVKVVHLQFLYCLAHLLFIVFL